ncbi:hypothetical protein H4I95_05682 [Botrytis cinerea]
MASQLKKIPDSLPPRPKPNHENPYSIPFKAQGLPPQAADMLFAMDQGLYYLALSILRIDGRGIEFDRSVFKESRSPIENIVNVLLSISKETLRHAITGKLHNFIVHSITDSKLPRNHRIPLPGPEKSQDRPVVYSLVHSDHRGNAPTKLEYLEILNTMEIYNTTYYREDQWIDADKSAREIDSVNPMIEDKDWNGKNRDKTMLKWNNAVHPRRYITSTNRGLITRFISKLRERLESIEDIEEDEPLKWSLTYTGWTQQEARRAYEHGRHYGGSTIAYLLEAIMWYKYPRKRYLLRSLTIANVADVESIRFAEHVISILTGSYFSCGGLCGTIGGDRASETRANNNCTEETWKNGTRGLLKQNVYGPNREELERDLLERELLEMYNEEGSEFRMVKEQEELLDQSKKDLQDSCEIAHEAINLLATNRITQMEKYLDVNEVLTEIGALKGLKERTNALLGSGKTSKNK